MKTKVKLCLTLLLALAMLVPLISLTTQANQRDEYRQELAGIHRSIIETQNQRDQTTRQLTQAEREMEALGDEIMYTMLAMIELNYTLDIVEARFENALLELEAAREFHAAQQAIVNERLRDLHEHGQPSLLDVLVQSSSVRDFMLRMEFMTRISRHDQNMLERLADAEVRYVASVEDEARQRTLIENVIVELERSTVELELLLDEWELRHEGLLADRASFEEQLAAYQAQARTVEQEIARLDRLEAQRLEEQRQRELAARFMGGTGEMLWPVSGFHHISSGFGMRPNPFNRRQQEMHHGIDIAGRNAAGQNINGAPVSAAGDGLVTRAATGWNGGFGTMVVIDHGGGTTTLYAHLSRLNVREGDWVRAGDTIGFVGSTGNSTGPHLHFEVRRNGQRVNPMPFLEGR